MARSPRFGACRGSLVTLAALGFLIVPSIGWSTESARSTSEQVVRQSWSLGCGPAALATILTFQFGDRVSEAEITGVLLQTVDPNRVSRRGGFSFLDMKGYAETHNYNAVGYGDLTLADLSSLGPSIVRLRDELWNHFVVFRGVGHTHVLVADPVTGTRTIAIDEFERLWSDRDALVISRPESAATEDLPNDGLKASATEVDAFLTSGAIR
jgi:hypothetical protein